MPVLTNWMTTASNRAMDAWRRIQDKPTAITIARLGTAQTVRVEYDSSVGQPNGQSIQTAQERIVVFGIKDHPTLPDTNIRRDDTFYLDDAEASQYVIDSVIPTLGELQAIGRRLT